MAQELFIERAAIHDEALARIKADFAISDEKWLEFMGDFDTKVAADSLLGYGALPASNGQDPQIVQTTRNILIERGINPEKVVIKLVASSDTPAQAVQELNDNQEIVHRIELDLYRLNKLSPAIQEALINHEVMHLLNYDSLEGSYLITLLYQLGHSAQKLEKSPCIIAYRHQRELRADLLAGCDHPEVARSLQDYFASYMKIADQNNERLWTTHPSDKTRFEALALLMKDIKIDNASVIA